MPCRSSTSNGAAAATLATLSHSISTVPRSSVFSLQAAALELLDLAGQAVAVPQHDHVGLRGRGTGGAERGGEDAHASWEKSPPQELTRIAIHTVLLPSG